MKSAEEIEQLAFEEFGNYSMYATGAKFGYDLGLKDSEQFKPKWIPVKEANLEDGKAYYVFTEGHGQHNDCIYQEASNCFVLSVLRFVVEDVTHVMNSIPNP